MNAGLSVQLFSDFTRERTLYSKPEVFTQPLSIPAYCGAQKEGRLSALSGLHP